MCKKGMDSREMLRPLSDYRCRCGCGLLNISEELVKLDEDVIGIVGFKPDISSACRCAVHNRSKEVGGSETSSHVCDKEKKCTAIDYSIRSSWERAVILEALVELKIRRIGIGEDFLHWDRDPKKPFPLIWVYREKKKIQKEG